MSLPPSLWFELALLAFLAHELWALHRSDRRGQEKPRPEGQRSAPENPS